MKRVLTLFVLIGTVLAICPSGPCPSDTFTQGPPGARPDPEPSFNEKIDLEAVRACIHLDREPFQWGFRVTTRRDNGCVFKSMEVQKDYVHCNGSYSYSIYSLQADQVVVRICRNVIQEPHNEILLVAFTSICIAQLLMCCCCGVQPMDQLLCCRNDRRVDKA
jgi:hypothetical protein